MFLEWYDILLLITLWFFIGTLVSKHLIKKPHYHVWHDTNVDDLPANVECIEVKINEDDSPEEVARKVKDSIPPRT